MAKECHQLRISHSVQCQLRQCSVPRLIANGNESVLTRLSAVQEQGTAMMEFLS
jgi:hypothetical protein